MRPAFTSASRSFNRKPKACAFVADGAVCQKSLKRSFDPKPGTDRRLVCRRLGKHYARNAHAFGLRLNEGFIYVPIATPGVVGHSQKFFSHHETICAHLRTQSYDFLPTF